MNPVNVLNTLTKVIAKGKGGIVRDRLKEAEVQSYDLLLIDGVGTGGGTRLSNYAVDANATDSISVSQFSVNKDRCFMIADIKMRTGGYLTDP